MTTGLVYKNFNVKKPEISIIQFNELKSLLNNGVTPFQKRNYFKEIYREFIAEIALAAFVLIIYFIFISLLGTKGDFGSIAFFILLGFALLVLSLFISLFNFIYSIWILNNYNTKLYELLRKNEAYQAFQEEWEKYEVS